MRHLSLAFFALLFLFAMTCANLAPTNSACSFSVIFAPANSGAA
jgi:hypothetical protein